MFVTFHFDTGLREVAQLLEEIRSEMGVTPVTLSLSDCTLVNYNQADIASVLAGTMTRSEYIERNKCSLLD